MIRMLLRRITRFFTPAPPKIALPPEIERPAPQAPWEARKEKLREQTDPEVRKWLRPWNGNGLPKSEYENAVDLENPRARGGILHDHPASRRGNVAPCPECRYPQFGWGGWDHWPECPHARKPPGV